MSRRGRKRKGSTLRNHFEDKVQQDLFKEFGRHRVSYESTTLPYTIDYTYLPDFVVDLGSGKELFVEAKGYFDYQAQRKMRAVKECHPDKEFLIIFQKDKPIRKGSKIRYSDWCKKHGFNYRIVND